MKRLLGLTVGLLVVVSGAVLAADNPFTKMQIFGGQIQYAAMSPADTSVIYAGNSDTNLWVSKDAGETWVPTGLRTATNGRSAETIIVHPDSAAVIIAINAENGIYRSEDYGDTWTKVYTGSTGAGKRTKFAYAAPDTFFVSANQNTGGMILRSTNAGVFWSEIDVPVSGKPLRDITVSGNGTVFVDVVDATPPDTSVGGNNGNNAKLYKSTDGGDTWTAISTNTLPIVPALISASSNTVVVGGFDGGASNLYISTDNAASFALVDPNLSINTASSKFAVSKEGTAIYFCDGSFSADGYRVKKSTFTDSGWGTLFPISQAVLDGTKGICPGDILVDEANDTMFITDGLEMAMLKSTDAGVTWAVKNNGIDSFIVYDGAKDPLGNLYVLGASSVYKSTDAAATWVGVNYSTADTSLGSYVKGAIACNPDPDHPYVYAIDYIGMMCSTDGGQSWDYVVKLPDQGHSLVPRRIVFNKSNPAIGYFGYYKSNVTEATSGNYIYKTTDYGLTWSTINFVSQGVHALAIDPSGSPLYAGTGDFCPWGVSGSHFSGDGLWAITDDSGTITAERIGLAGLAPYLIAIDTTNTNVLMVAANGAIDSGDIHVSTNKGQSWSLVRDGSNSFSTVSDIAYSYPAFFLAAKHLGIFATVNHGGSVDLIADEMAVGFVRSLILGSLYAGTDTGLWKLTGAIPHGGGSTAGGGVKAYNYPNPVIGKGTSTTIVYSYAGSPSNAKVKIYTLSGELVWEYEDTPPTGAVTWTGKNKNGGYCAPGLYQAVVDIDGTKARHKIVLVY